VALQSLKSQEQVREATHKTVQEPHYSYICCVVNFLAIKEWLWANRHTKKKTMFYYRLLLIDRFLRLQFCQNRCRHYALLQLCHYKISSVLNWVH